MVLPTRYRFFHQLETLRPAGWSRSAPGLGSRPVRLEQAAVDCCANCAFRLDVPSGSVQLPQSAEPASRFVVPLESGQPAGWMASLASRVLSTAEQLWNHRLRSEHEKRSRAQPQVSARPRPVSNRSSDAAERRPFRVSPYARPPAAESLVSRLSAGRSASPGASAQWARELAARKQVP